MRTRTRTRTQVTQCDWNNPSIKVYLIFLLRIRYDFRVEFSFSLVRFFDQRRAHVCVFVWQLGLMALRFSHIRVGRREYKIEKYYVKSVEKSKNTMQTTMCASKVSATAWDSSSSFR